MRSAQGRCSSLSLAPRSLPTVSALEKAVERLLANPHEASFADVRRVLEGHGWLIARTEGSHHHFVKDGEPDILTVPVHNKRVTRTYIRRLVNRLGLAAQ